MNPVPFMALTRVTASGCWEWLGPRTPAGRLVYRSKSGRKEQANRYACELETGTSPTGHLVRHCSNPLCVRYAPGHWQASRASLEITEAAPLRRDTDLSPEEVADFIVRYWKGTKATRLMVRFHITEVAFQRLRDRAQANVPRMVA